MTLSQNSFLLTPFSLSLELDLLDILQLGVTSTYNYLNIFTYMGRSVVYFELKQNEKGINDLKKAAALFLEQNDRAN